LEESGVFKERSEYPIKPGEKGTYHCGGISGSGGILKEGSDYPFSPYPQSLVPRERYSPEGDLLPESNYIKGEDLIYLIEGC